MAVYVDDMYRSPMGRFGRMKMSHMVADTEEELYEMARAIRLNTKWVQHAEMGKGWIHFDVSMQYRQRAVNLGAIELSMRDLARMTMNWKRIARREKVRAERRKLLTQNR